MEALTINSPTLLAAASLSVMALKTSDRMAMTTSSMEHHAGGGNELVSPETVVTEGHLDASISLANDLLRRHSVDLVFEVQRYPNQVVVRLRDTGSGQILKEYSSQAMLTMVAAMSVAIGGLLHDVA
ncbi:flagellar protein FlaG [Pseudogulbenkiania sp. MAI-1]|uniref:flagellar protein FlaG n=1 Tax=Pseudogulbenkiania sp. MAI-1 TaxID=990370 RepID=UPI00045EC1B4|nr:flagellar protein FlaG [Pseudogulbenkiania sp. MAI-1]